jgi:hypothetical protein
MRHSTLLVRGEKINDQQVLIAEGESNHEVLNKILQAIGERRIDFKHELKVITPTGPVYIPSVIRINKTYLVNVKEDLEEGAYRTFGNLHESIIKSLIQKLKTDYREKLLASQF